MNRLLALVAIGSVMFGIASAAAASLGTGLSTTPLSAAYVAIGDCGDAGAVALTYDITTNGSYFVVTKAILTTTSGSFTDVPSCVNSTATVNFGATEVYKASITSGDMSNGGKTMTLDVTDTAVSLATDFSILIR